VEEIDQLEIVRDGCARALEAVGGQVSANESIQSTDFRGGRPCRTLTSGSRIAIAFDVECFARARVRGMQRCVGGCDAGIEDEENRGLLEICRENVDCEARTFVQFGEMVGKGTTGLEMRKRETEPISSRNRCASLSGRLGSGAL
jgi:hypothetical protein